VSPEERSAQARKAIAARWAKATPEQGAAQLERRLQAACQPGSQQRVRFLRLKRPLPRSPAPRNPETKAIAEVLNLPSCSVAGGHAECVAARASKRKFFSLMFPRRLRNLSQGSGYCSLVPLSCTMANSGRVSMTISRDFPLAFTEEAVKKMILVLRSKKISHLRSSRLIWIVRAIACILRTENLRNALFARQTRWRTLWVRDSKDESVPTLLFTLQLPWFFDIQYGFFSSEIGTQ